MAQELILMAQDLTLEPQESTLVAQELTLVPQESTLAGKESATAVGAVTPPGAERPTAATGCVVALYYTKRRTPLDITQFVTGGRGQTLDRVLLFLMRRVYLF